MRKAFLLIAIIILAGSTSLFAQARHRGVRSASEPSGPTFPIVPAAKIWVADAYTTWQDAAAAFVAMSGEGMMMKTGDVDTPYVVLRQTVSGSYLQIPPPIYRAEAVHSMNGLISLAAGQSWWRAVSTDDGGMVVLTKN